MSFGVEVAGGSWIGLGTRFRIRGGAGNNGNLQTETIATGGQTTYRTFVSGLPGRVLRSSQTINGIAYPALSYTYNLAGNVETEVYPSGRTVRTCYDAAGRAKSLSGVTSQLQTTNYASAVSYVPHGAISSMMRGDGLVEGWNYNSRLQPSAISVGTATAARSAFGFDVYYCAGSAGSCSTNNGNVQSTTLGGLGATQQYLYDPFNRLKSAMEGSAWKETFGYDSFGNRWVDGGNSAGVSISPFAATASSNFDSRNWLQTGNSKYDAAGTLRQMGAWSNVLDAEGRMASSAFTMQTGEAPQTTTYSYDGDGRRVMKQGSTTTAYLYDAQGEVVAEYGGAATVAACTTCYLTVDHLGSTRLMTDGVTATPVERHDYRPFGEELFAGTGGRTAGLGYLTADAGDDLRRKFTGKERDAETGLDYFGARYLSSAQGRFTSPDWSPTPQAVPYADLTDPQTLNLYSYVRNNPLSRADADGHCFWDACIAEATAVVAGVGATAAYLASPAGQRAIAATVALVNKTTDAIGRGLDALNSAPSACGVSCTSEFYPGPGASVMFSKGQATQPYDVGSANDLKGNSATGGNLDVHHVPQQQPAGQIVDGYDGKTGSAIALPKGEHRAIPTEKGDAARSPRDQLAKDARDLRNNTNAPNSKVKEVIDLAKKKYPEMNKQPQ